MEVQDLTQAAVVYGPPAASTFVRAGFVVFTALLGSAIVWLVYRAGRASDEDPARTRVWTVGTALGLASWMGATGLIASAGVLARFDLRPPPFAFLVLSVFVLSFTLAFGRFGDRLVRGLPLWMLVASQSFRLPLEWLMHETADEGVMPVQMSYEGWNFDVVTGITAIIVAWMLKTGRAGRTLALAWNVLGLLLLTNILTIAVVSTPIFAAFGPDRLNTWVFYPPFVWLPTVMVAWAITGHLLVARHVAIAMPRYRDG
jgi:hypothetical protein